VLDAKSVEAANELEFQKQITIFQKETEEHLSFKSSEGMHICRSCTFDFKYQRSTWNL